MNPLRLWACAGLLLPGLLWAHGDDDHGAASAPAPTQTLSPRVEASSELFELVGILQGGQLVIHLDRFATNEPVTGAKIAVEGGPLKATAAAEHDGVYALPAAGLAAVGTYPLVFTVQAGAESDLLTGDLVVGAPAAAAGAAAAAPQIDWRWMAAAVAAVFVLGAGALAWRRRRVRAAGAFQ